MQKKYGHDKGVLLVALSDEPDAKVRSFVKANNMNYVVGSDANPTFKDFGVRGYPTVFVMDPNGKIIYKGHSAEDAEDIVDELLKKNPPKAMTLGAASGSAALAKANDLYARKEYAKALKEFDRIAKSSKDSEIVKTAKAKAAEIRANPQAMAAVNEAEVISKCESWLQLARNLASAGKDDEAAKYYQRILDEFPASKFAAIARRELKG